MKLSILMPVYNEKDTIAEILKKVYAVRLPIEKEIIVVDDCSNDGTTKILKKLNKKYKFKLYFHIMNQGKGAAVKTALNQAVGDFIIFQDADLEYDPEDYSLLIQPFIEKKADIILGSRFLSGQNVLWQKPTFYDYFHYLGNRFQSFVMSFLYGRWMTDIWTCYKVFRRDVINSVNIQGNRFDYEIELMSKLLKRPYKVVEVPIKYHPRLFVEGKKITWKDGIRAFVVTLKYRFL